MLTPPQFKVLWQVSWINQCMYFPFSDFDECGNENITTGCEHQCINTPGSYICSCDEGHTLHSDNRSCTGIICTYKVANGNFPNVIQWNPLWKDWLIAQFRESSLFRLLLHKPLLVVFIVIYMQTVYRNLIIIGPIRLVMQWVHLSTSRMQLASYCRIMYILSFSKAIWASCVPL